MINKIVEAKKKKANKTKTKGNLYAMGSAVGNRMAGKILTPQGEKGKMSY